MQVRKGGETESTEQLDDAGVEEILRLVEAANIRGIARRRRRFRWRLFVLLTAVLVLGAVVAYRVGFWPGDEQTSKVSSSAGAPATRSIPDFVWVAAEGASHYRVEFLLGTRVVHTATTSVPRLHVAAASLPPGRYRWRVWAVDTSGARLGRAVVDASVNIR